MNTIKCQIFLKAVELGSITRAAEDMGYTQSAVSRSIADLEREWDVTLLTRNKDGVVLTAQGESLLPDIQSLCNAQRTLESQVSALHGLTSGTLRVGTFTSVLHSLGHGKPLWCLQETDTVDDHCHTASRLS